MEDVKVPFQDMEARDRRNWAFSFLEVAGVVLLCLWRLAFATPGQAGWPVEAAAEVPALVLNTFVAGLMTLVLGMTFFDRIPMVVQYRVAGREDIPMVQYSLGGPGRWTTFTVWSNTIGAVYFWLAAVAGLRERLGASRSELLINSCAVLWEITFPIAFLVNAVVTFVLIPMIKKQGAYQKLWYILRWRPQTLHNGFVLAAALEAVILLPPIAMDDVPIIMLYGVTYVVFSWLLFWRLRFFHYFFLDPRFRYAPVALIVLPTFLAVLYCVGAASIHLSARCRPVGALLLLAALATCTFRDSAARAPEADPGASHA